MKGRNKTIENKEKQENRRRVSMKPISFLQTLFFFFKAKNLFPPRAICLWVFPPKGSSSLPPRAPLELPSFQEALIPFFLSQKLRGRGDGVQQNIDP